MNPHFIFNSIGGISGFISQNHPKTAIKYLAKFAKLMRNTLEHSKRSVISIKDEVDNLNHYILLEQMRFNNQFDFELLVEPTINQELLIPAMFIQPYVENAIVHGIVPKEEKGSIRVEFYRREEQLICTIADNGIGRKRAKIMNADSELEHLSSAMEINEKRIKAINAMSKKKMKIEVIDLYDENGLEKGTRIELIIYPKAKE